mgnify:CR=1 FL=1
MGTELTRFDLTRQALIMGRPPSRRDFPYADIGSRIRTAREARGLSQTEIAELLGYQYQSGYQKIESGQQPPSVDVLRRLHMVLGLTPNELLLGDAEDILDDIPDDVTEEDVARLKAAALAEAALLRALNATATDYDDTHCVHETIAARAALVPEQTAIDGQTQSLTFEAMETQAGVLAARLRRRGVQPGDVIGLCLERSPDLVLSLLAIWKAGAAYVPLDPEAQAFMQSRVDDYYGAFVIDPDGNNVEAVCHLGP